MPFPKGQNPNHPTAGSTIKVEPIRDKKAIQRIKKILADRPRALCLFTLGINTAYRANELLSLKVGQVKNLQAGDVLDLKQRKTPRLAPIVVRRRYVRALKASPYRHSRSSGKTDSAGVSKPLLRLIETVQRSSQCFGRKLLNGRAGASVSLLPSRFQWYAPEHNFLLADSFNPQVALRASSITGTSLTLHPG